MTTYKDLDITAAELELVGACIVSQDALVVAAGALQYDDWRGLYGEDCRQAFYALLGRWERGAWERGANLDALEGLESFEDMWCPGAFNLEYVSGLVSAVLETNRLADGVLAAYKAWSDHSPLGLTERPRVQRSAAAAHASELPSLSITEVFSHGH